MKRDKTGNVNRRNFLQITWGALLAGMIGQAGFNLAPSATYRRDVFISTVWKMEVSLPSGSAAPTWGVQYPGSKPATSSTVPVTAHYLHPPEKLSAVRLRGPWTYSPLKSWMAISLWIQTTPFSELNSTLTR